MELTKHIYNRLVILIILVPYDLMAYPVLGMRRYGRSTTHPQSDWGMSSVMHLPYYYQAIPRPQPYQPLNYYETMNLYAPDYDDYYYPQDSVAYPLYYPTFTRTASSNYDMYQPVIPYYYNPSSYDYYGTSDPVKNMQDEEREEREEALPIGQETWYEPDESTNHDEDSIDEINAAFMKNLMLYNKALSNPNYAYGKVQPEDAYDQQYSQMENWNIPPYYNVDKEEEELKMLNESPKKSNKKHNKAEERLQMFEKSRSSKTSRHEPNNSESWLKYGNKRTSRPEEAEKERKHEKSLVARKPQIASSTSAPILSSTIPEIRDARGGQKEVVMIRPATPVRRPFSEPVMQLLAQQGGSERKRTPSVYDTIKHMLEMEKNLEKQEYQTNGFYRPAMRKRYVSSEESLVEELAGLKKTA